MRRDPGQSENIIERKVAVADGIEAVHRNARKTQFARDGVAIDGKRISRERAGAHRTRVSACSSVLESSDVTTERFGVREQKMRKQNRLRMLHVSHARHRYAEICFGLKQK